LRAEFLYFLLQTRQIRWDCSKHSRLPLEEWSIVVAVASCAYSTEVTAGGSSQLAASNIIISLLFETRWGSALGVVRWLWSQEGFLWRQLLNLKGSQVLRGNRLEWVLVLRRLRRTNVQCCLLVDIRSNRGFQLDERRSLWILGSPESLISEIVQLREHISWITLETRWLRFGCRREHRRRGGLSLQEGLAHLAWNHAIY